MIKKTSPLSVIAAGAFFVSSLFTIAFTAFFIYLCFRQPSITVMVIFFLIDVFCCSLSTVLIVILRSLSFSVDMSDHGVFQKVSLPDLGRDQGRQSLPIPVVPGTVTNI